MLKKRQLILAKIEGTYGVDPVPTTADNAVLATGIEFQVVGRRLERAAALSWMGKHPAVNIGEGLRLKFTTEIRGKGGAATTPPEFGPLLRSCNFTETITTDVAYTLNSNVGTPESGESCAIYYYQDRKFHKLLGCRGSVVENAKAGEYGTFAFEMTGIYAGAVAVAAIPTGTFNSTVPPRFVSANFSIDTYAAIIESLSVDLGNNVVMRKSANAATGILEWMITDRDPKGNIDPEVPDLVAATLTTAQTGANNDLKLTAHATNYPGIDGNDITLEYEDTATAGAETVTVTGTDIVVGIETGVSTSAQVKTALEASPAAMALLASVAHKIGDNGSGTVITTAAANLSGGTGLDFWKRWADSTGMAATWQYGSATGNTCVVAAANAQLDVPNYADREELLTHGAGLILAPTAAGNDEISYTFS